MRVLILLHSATGNTRVVTRYAAHHLRQLGMEVTVQDIGRHRTMPDLEGIDLFGMAFPVMYGWPTLAMLQMLSRVRAPGEGTPAFVLSTAAADPGAALHIACERLRERGFSPMGAHWVMAPSSYPAHVAPVRWVEQLPGVRRGWNLAKAVGRRAWTRHPAIRPLMSMAWLEASEPTEGDRETLDRYLDGVAGQTMAVRAGARAWGPDLAAESHRPLVKMGYAFPPEKAIASISFRVDMTRCQACHACVAACPVDSVVADGEGHPHFGPGCTGCFACYNACPNGALCSFYSPAGGTGRYKGPSRAMRKLFHAVDPA